MYVLSCTVIHLYLILLTFGYFCIKNPKRHGTHSLTQWLTLMTLMIKEKDKETENQNGSENLSMNKTSFNHSEIEHATSTPKEKSGKVEKVEDKVALKSCKECKYKCKKEETLKKHMTTKHSEYQRKDCQEKLPTFMHLLKTCGTAPLHGSKGDTGKTLQGVP